MYTCPMHPEIIQEGGLCPTCGMDLVPMEPKSDKRFLTYGVK
jgi:Cu2+-exporting ATPase